MSKRSRRRALFRARDESIGPALAADRNPRHDSADRGISCDQEPDTLFAQAFGIARDADRILQDKRETHVKIGYLDLLNALKRAGVEFAPGEAQKFEIVMEDGVHSVWIETPS